MYTLNNLQEKLERARNTLREVESTISKVEGKPPNLTFNMRFSKGDKRIEKEEQVGEKVRSVSNETLRRRRVVDESTSRRHADDDGAWRTFVDKSSDLRRRPALSPEDGPTPRKRIFSSAGMHDANVREALHDRRRSIFSALGKVQKNENPRSKYIRPRDEDIQRSQHRSIFSRLSGLHNESDVAVDDEDEQILQRRSGDDTPSIASHVHAIQRPTLSREEVLASENKDEKSKQRDRRMFGALVGTLQQFRREETQVKEREQQRQKIEKKLEDEAVRDRERMAEEKRKLLSERRRREADIKRIEWSMNRVKEFADWEAGVLLLRNFIRTNSKPHVFFMPKVHTEKTKELLQNSSNAIDEMVEKRRAALEAEISSSEQKALRAAGELGDVDKENDADGGNIGDKDSIQEEGDDAEWADATYDQKGADEEIGEKEEALPVDDIASENAGQVPANIPLNDDNSAMERAEAANQVAKLIGTKPSRSPTTSPKSDTPTKEPLTSKKVQSRSPSKKDSSRSRRSKKRTKAKRADLSPQRRKKSKSRDSDIKPGIQERLERLAGQGGSSGPHRREAKATSRGSSSRSHSSSSSSSSQKSSSSSDDS